MKFLKKLTEAFLLLFVFTLPWQTKLIIMPAFDNFTEISLYVSHLFLLLALITFFSYQLTRKESAEKVSLVWYSLLGLELSVLASFFFSADKFLATYHYILVLGGLGVFYLLHEGFKAAPYEESCLNRSRAVIVFLSSIFLHSILGIYQFLSQKSFAFKFLGLSSHDPQNAGVSVIETVSGRWLRAYGGLDHPNIFGGVLVFALLLSAFLLARKKIINSKIEIWGVALLFFSYFFALIALFFTFSRTAWMAFFVGLVFLAIKIFKKEERWVFQRFLAVVFFSCVLFILAGLPYKELVFTRINANSRLEQISITERKEYATAALAVIKNNPLLGVGKGNYITEVRSQQYVTSYPQQPVHNTFLLIFAESGLFAFLSLVAILLLLAISKKAQTFSLPIIIALFIIMMFDHWLLSLPFGILFLFFILGVI